MACAAPRTVDWMLGTPSLGTLDAPSLRDIARQHLALLQTLAAATGHPEIFAEAIGRTRRALVARGRP